MQSFCHSITIRRKRILRHIANAYRLIYQGNFSVQDAVQKIIDQVPMSEEIENIVNFVKRFGTWDCEIDKIHFS